MVHSLNITDKLGLEIIDLVVKLNAFLAPLRVQAQSQLRVLEAEIVKEVLSQDLESLSGYLTRVRKLERILKQIGIVLDRRYGFLLNKVGQELRTIPKFTQDGLLRKSMGIFKIGAIKRSLLAIQLRAVADQDIVLGEPVADWLMAQKEALRRRIVQQLRMGVTGGETNSSLIQRLRGRPTGRTIEVQLPRGFPRRIKEYAGGVFDSSRTHADVLIRTASMSLFNKTLLKVYQENTSTIIGFQSWSVWDRGSTDVCKKRNGLAWFLDGQSMTKGSKESQFPGPPPWHFQCHTTLIPVMKSWKTLSMNRRLRKIPKAVRSIMDGQGDSGVIKTIKDWVRLYGETEAIQQLGPRLYSSWKNGRITTTQLIDAAGA